MTAVPKPRDSNTITVTAGGTIADLSYEWNEPVHEESTGVTTISWNVAGAGLGNIGTYRIQRRTMNLTTGTYGAWSHLATTRNRSFTDWTAEPQTVNAYNVTARTFDNQTQQVSSPPVDVGIQIIDCQDVNHTSFDVNKTRLYPGFANTSNQLEDNTYVWSINPHILDVSFTYSVDGSNVPCHTVYEGDLEAKKITTYKHRISDGCTPPETSCTLSSEGQPEVSIDINNFTTREHSGVRYSHLNLTPTSPGLSQARYQVCLQGRPEVCSEWMQAPVDMYRVKHVPFRANQVTAE